MITTIFSKSRPFNYALISIGLITCFVLYQMRGNIVGENVWSMAYLTVILLILLASIFISNFITKRNNLSKDNSYVFLFFFCMMILFPTALGNFKLITANFLVLLALRRLISLQSLVAPKQKIFDASLWIFAASILHFWSILFIALVFISIFLHVGRDYRNWLLPYIAFCTIAVLLTLISLIAGFPILEYIQNQAVISFNFNYFTNQYQNIALSIFSAITVLFLFSQITTFASKPLILINSYKKIIIAFFIGVTIYIISPEKSNNILIYTFMPLSVMATGFFENIKIKWYGEITAILIITLSFLSFFLQL